MHLEGVRRWWEGAWRACNVLQRSNALKMGTSQRVVVKPLAQPQPHLPESVPPQHPSLSCIVSFVSRDEVAQHGVGPQRMGVVPTGSGPSFV